MSPLNSRLVSTSAYLASLVGVVNRLLRFYMSKKEFLILPLNMSQSQSPSSQGPFILLLLRMNLAQTHNPSNGRSCCVIFKKGFHFFTTFPRTILIQITVISPGCCKSLLNELAVSTSVPLLSVLNTEANVMLLQYKQDHVVHCFKSFHHTQSKNDSHHNDLQEPLWSGFPLPLWHCLPSSPWCSDTVSLLFFLQNRHTPTQPFVLATSLYVEHKPPNICMAQFLHLLRSFLQYPRLHYFKLQPSTHTTLFPLSIFLSYEYLHYFLTC